MNANAKPSPDVKDVLNPDRALVPHTVRLHEQTIARGFWPKVRKVATRLPFISDIVAVWYCARDRDTPAAAKGIMLAALAYFVVPTDAVPDLIAGLGFTDDAAVIAAVIAVVGRNLKPRHREAAADLLERLQKD